MTPSNLNQLLLELSAQRETLTEYKQYVCNCHIEMHMTRLLNANTKLQSELQEVKRLTRFMQRKESKKLNDNKVLKS